MNSCSYFLISNRVGCLLILALLVPRLPAAEDPALVPTVVETAAKEKYGPEARRFQGIPGLARSPRGRLWATWYGGGVDEGPENYVMIATSENDGDTWSMVKYVIDPPGEVRTYDPVVWVDPKGRLWWFYAQSYKWWDGRAGVWAVTTDEPDSANPKWSEARRIADGIMMQKPTVRKNSEWLLPIAVWSHAPKTQSVPGHPRNIPESYLHWNPARVGTHIYQSRDEGETFVPLGTARVPDVRFEEHMTVERKDNSLWLLARTNAGISESVSLDDGRTWTEGKPSAIPHAPSRFFIRRLHSGRLLLVKHNPRMDTVWLGGKPVINVWSQRSHLTAYLSEDDGKTWGGGLLLDGRLAVSYPDGDQAQDGTIFIVYDYNRHTDKEILLSRFAEADVLAGKIVTSGSRLAIPVNKATGPDSR